MGKWWIGIDLGATNIRVALYDSIGNCVDLTKENTDKKDGAESTINQILNLIKLQIQKNKIDIESLGGIGIGMPGPLDANNGIVFNLVNLEGWDGIHLSKRIEEYFNVPCFIENDANVAALGEAVYGAGKGYEIVYYLTISTGVGGGLVYNGQIINGATGNAGEIANIIVKDNEAKHSFLNSGSLEGSASGTAILREALEKGLEVNTTEDVFEKMLEGNLVATQIIDKAADSLGKGMAAIAHIVDPNVFVLGGGVMDADDIFLEKVKSSFEGYIYKVMRGKIDIKKAELSNPGTVGAALMVQNRLKKKNSDEKELLVFKRAIHEKIWGFEDWSVSGYKGSESIIVEGKYSGMSLSTLWDKHKELFGYQEGSVFPLLVKTIDTKEDLSIQVHPGDDSEDGEPKTECWYIADCSLDSEIVYGHTANNKEELLKMIKENRWDELLCRMPIRKGDFINVPSGTVHALTGKMRIIEVQQPSDTTYRLYDYGRKVEGVERELHIEKSILSMKVPFIMGKQEQRVEKFYHFERHTLIESPQFTVIKYDVRGHADIEQIFPYLIIGVIEGKGTINGKDVSVGDFLIAPYHFGKIRIQGNIICLAATVNFER